MAQTIYQKIEQKAIADAKEILKAGDAKAQAAMAAAVAAAEARNAELLAKTDEKNASLRKTRTTEFEQAERQVLLALKKSLIDEVQIAAAKNLQALSDAEWAVFVVRTLSADDLRGGETIIASALDRPRFLALFSTGEATSRGTLLAKLDRELSGKPGLILSAEVAPIEGGFLVEGADFDIDHSHRALLAGLKERHESELAAILFAPRD